MLPTLSVPQFVTKLPSTGEEIKFRPFLVKEEKILLFALEDGEKETIIRAVIDLLKNCILNEINIEELPTFDIEYLFMKVRAKSVGEEIEMVLSHGQSSECDAKTKYVFNIDEIDVEGSVREGKIELQDNIGIKLKYPSYQKDKNSNKDADSLFQMIKENIEYVYDSENIYDDFTEEEITSWIENLNNDQFDKILDFFVNGPSLRHMIEWDCPSCNKKDFAVVEGLKDFFMLA